MKLPICSFDARIGVLCPKCEARLRAGEISRTDVDVSFMLAKLAHSIPYLSDVTLKKAYEVDGDLVLILDRGQAASILSNREVRRKLEEHLNRKVWITEEEKDERRFLEGLLYPARILTLNTVWLPDGSKQMKAIIPGSGRRFPIDLEKVKRIVRETLGLELVIKFELEGRFRKKSLLHRSGRRY
jgi:transcription antitermination factor NusA-like protein